MKCFLSHLSARGSAPVSHAARSFQCRFAKLAVFVAAVGWFLAPLQSQAVAYTYTTFSDLESVYADNGITAWSQSPNIKVIGTVINNPADMSNYNNYYINSDPNKYYDATWWQVYVQALPEGNYNGQAVAANDFGGVAAYMRVNDPRDKTVPVYEPGNLSGQWGGEMDRVNYPLDASGQKVSQSLRYGDIVMIEANSQGLHNNGKYNINEMHSTDPLKDFTITILARDTKPVATPIMLTDLKNGSDFLFDKTTIPGSDGVATRATGCEHYQASLVHLDDLTLVNTDSNDWRPEKTVTVQQGNLTFPMRLGLDSKLFDAGEDWFNKLKSGPFSVTAILDQEDSSSPYTGGYRLWLTSASELTAVPEPGCFVLLAVAASMGLLWRRRKAS
jgi:hypothetical protein